MPADCRRPIAGFEGLAPRSITPATIDHYTSHASRVETRAITCYVFGKVFARSRLFAGLAAAVLSAASLVQVGCGVFHCVERTEVATSESAPPPCHGAESDAPNESRHAPGGGDEDCCQIVPVEPAPSHAVHGAPSLALAAHRVGAPASPAFAPRLAPRAPADTGPPSALGVASVTPLRI